MHHQAHEYDEDVVRLGIRLRLLPNSMDGKAAGQPLCVRDALNKATVPKMVNELIQTRTDAQRGAMGFSNDWLTRHVWG